MDKLIQLKKEYASYGEYDGIYAKEVQEMIDELLNDLNEDEKPQKILYQPQAYGTPWLCPACGADQAKTEFLTLMDLHRKKRLHFAGSAGRNWIGESMYELLEKIILQA